jgi:hypothetical protein
MAGVEDDIRMRSGDCGRDTVDARCIIAVLAGIDHAQAVVVGRLYRALLRFA